MYNYGGGGMDYDAYRKEMRERAMARLKKQQELQTKIDAIEDPQKRIEANRERYACGDKFVPLSKIQSWDKQAAKLVTLAPDFTTVAKSPAGGRMGGFSMFSRNDDVKITDEDCARRFAVNETLVQKVSIHQGDITRLEIDGIVNAANGSLMGGGGIDGAIHDAAGALLDDECEALGGCETGNTKATRGYQLPAQYVLHTVGPIGGGDKALEGCYKSILDIASEKKMRTIAFCCVSTGIFGFPLVRATHIGLMTVRQWLEDPKNADSVDRIIFCVFRDVELQTYERLMPSYFPLPDFPASKDTVPLLKLKAAEEEERRSMWGGGGGMMGGGGGGMYGGMGGGMGGYSRMRDERDDNEANAKGNAGDDKKDK